MSKDFFPGRGAVLNDLAKQLRESGYTKGFLLRVVPDWWSPEAESIPSALAELKVILSRRLGLDLERLLDSGRAVPVAPNGMRFKRSTDLARENPPDATLAYLGAIGRSIATISEPSRGIGASPDSIRNAILANDATAFVSLENLLAYCWSHGVAVVHVAGLPGTRKGMAALSLRVNQRDVIIVTRMNREPAWVAFNIAHELGHIALGHIRDNDVLFDDDEADQLDPSAEEQATDHFAADILGGENLRDFWSRFDATPESFAKAVVKRAPQHRVDPAHVVLRYGKERNEFKFANASLKYISEESDKDGLRMVNAVAAERLDLSGLGNDAKALISDVIGLA